MLTAKQHAARSDGLGGSDASTVAGLNAYKTRLRLWLEKTGREPAPDLSDNEAVYWGNVLESVVADEYARRTKRRLRRRNITFYHRKHDWMLGHIDRDIVGERRVLECKTAGIRAASQWGDPGSDEVPEAYLVQVAHYLAVLNYDVADLAVLIGGNDFRIYTVERDLELERWLIELEAEFWNKHVVEDVPPSPECEDDCQRLWAADNGSAVVASGSVIEAVRELNCLLNSIATLEAGAEELKVRIKTFMGDAGELLLDDSGRKLASWKAPKSTTVFDAAAFRAEMPEVYQRYLKERANTRRFVISRGLEL